MSDDHNLRDKAREAIQAGELPHRLPDRTWGGPGVGACCTICGAPVKHDEIEIEAEVARDGDDPGCDKYRVHIRCFAAWESELDQIESAAPAALAGGSSESSSDTAVSLRPRVLPEVVDVGNIPGCECDKTSKRGAA